jgi:hypothetical protein
MNNVIENREFSKTEKNVQQKSWPRSAFNSRSVCIPIHHKFGSAVAGIAEHQKLEERSTAETVGHEELSFQIIYIDSGSVTSEHNTHALTQ